MLTPIANRIARRRATTAGAVLCGLLLAVLGGISPAAAAADDYVALGDSYSAGVGTRDSQDDCYRSPSGYPGLLAAQYGLDLDYQACSGATTADVQADQLAALSTATGAVSMTIGGNDAGFADVLTECAQPGWLSDCEGAIADGRAVVADDLPGRYDTLFSAIAARAPDAEVAVGGYPLIFNGEDCNAATFFSPEEESSLNAATGELDDLIADKSSAYGFGFVDPRSAFLGHAVCDDPEWINGLSNPVQESYHPNRAGNVGYAQLFGPVLTGRPYPTSARVALADRRADRVDVGERAQAVLAMRLDSPANLDRAERHGLDPDRIERLVERLRSSDRSEQRSALTELRRLDRTTDR